MEDKIIMETALSLAKSGCGLLMHGAIESNTPAIKKQFESSLQEFLTIQGDIFTEMESAGLYNVEAALESKIKKACDKHKPSL